MRTYELARWEEICGSAQAVAGGVVLVVTMAGLDNRKATEWRRMPKYLQGT